MVEVQVVLVDISLARTILQASSLVVLVPRQSSMVAGSIVENRQVHSLAGKEAHTLRLKKNCQFLRKFLKRKPLRCSNWETNMIFQASFTSVEGGVIQRGRLSVVSIS